MDKAAQYAKAAEFYKQALAEGADPDEARAAYDAAVGRIAAMPDVTTAAQPAAAQKAPRTLMQDVQGTLRAGVNGLTWGNADELMGGANALMSPTTKDGTYASERNKIREEQAAFQRAHPYVNAAAELAGGIATGGALKTLGGKAIPVISRLADQVGKRAIVQGALGGIGASDAEDAGGVAFDAAIGGTLGGVVGGVAGKVGQKAAEIMQRARGSQVARDVGAFAGRYVPGKIGEALSHLPEGRREPTWVGRRAVSALTDVVGDNGRITVPVLEQAGAANRGADKRLLDVMGVKGERFARGIRTMGGDAGEMLDDFSTSRIRTYPDRMVDAVRNGKTVDNVVESSKSFVAKRQAASSPLYDEFRTMPPVADDAVIEGLFKRPSMKGALKDAEKNMLEQDIPITYMDVTLPNGKIKQVPVRTPEFLDEVKKALDDRIFAAPSASAKDGGFKPGKARNEKATRKALVDRLDEIYRDPNGRQVYKEARDAWAGPTALKGAMNDGRDAMMGNLDPDELADEIKNFSQSELEMYQRGAAAGVRDMLEKGGLKPASTEHRAFLKRVEEAFGNDANDILTKIRDEVAATRTGTFVSGGSSTKSTGEDIGSVIAPENSNLWAAVLYNPKRAVSNVAGRMLGRDMAAPVGKATRLAATQMVLSPADNAKVLKSIAGEQVARKAGKSAYRAFAGPLAAETAYGFFRRPQE